MFKRLSKALSAMRHSPRANFSGRLLKRTRFDYGREVGDMLDASVVTAPVQWMARALPEARLVVRRRGNGGQVTEIAGHKLAALIAAPNPYYGDIALWGATVWSWCVAGNAYWIKVRNGLGRPAELWYVPHWTMEPVGAEDGSEFITHYLYQPGGGAGQMVLDPDDVVHFRAGLDPRNPRYGLSPLSGVIREIFMDLESSNFVASLLRNMGVPGVVISPKGGAMPAPEDVEATKAWFREAFGGDNRGGPLVMGAPTDVVPYGFNPQQMNMSEARDVAEERVCACLGIPAAVVGFGAGLQQTKVGATMSELRKLAWHNGVMPLARALIDELARSLLPDFGDAGGVELGWDTDEVLALTDDQDKQATRWSAMVQGGWAMVSEAREAMGLEVDDSHRIYLRPIASIETPAGGKLRPPAPAGGQKARASRVAMRRGEAYISALARAEGPLRDGFEGRLKGFFADLGIDAEAAAKKALPKGAKAQKASDDDLVAAILKALGIERYETTFADLFRAQYLEVGESIARAADLAGLAGRLPDPVARAIVAAGGRRAGLIDLEDQTSKALFDALAEGRAQGEGVQLLAARIRDQVEGGPWASAETRARIIARTETKYAQNISTLERARHAGVESFVVFDGRLGEGRSKPDHIARNGSIVTAAEADAMAAAEHPNGTLSFAPHFGDDDDD